MLAETARIAREAIQAESDRKADMIVYRTLADVFSDPVFWPSKSLFLGVLEEVQDRLLEAMCPDDVDARLEACVDAIRFDRLARRTAGKSRACSHARARGAYTPVTPELRNGVTDLRIADPSRDARLSTTPATLGALLRKVPTTTPAAPRAALRPLAKSARSRSHLATPPVMTRSTSSGSRSGDMTTLTPTTRRIAESMGLDEKGYWRG